MKKRLTFLALALVMALGINAQEIKDQAIITMGVTLNSILRLDVTKGGNIEFVVNTIEQYEDGIDNQARYDTYFEVASSVNFDVLMYAESGALYDMGYSATYTISGSQNIPLDNVGYEVESNGEGVDGTNWDLINTITALTPTATKIVTSKEDATGALGAGSTGQNSFIVHWELATSNLRTVTTQKTLLGQSISPGRYTSNVFLVLQPQ